MPVVERGILFRHFEKVACGVVALALLVSVILALRRGTGAARELDPEALRSEVAGITQKQGIKPPPLPHLTLAVDVRKQLAAGIAPRDVIRDPMLPPLPVVYPTQRIGTDMETVLEFDAPLAPGSVEVEGNESLVDSVRHPVDGDYSKVAVRAKRWEGEVRLSGLAGDTKHIMRLAIDKEVGKIPYAPLELAAQAQGDAIVIAFRADPRVAKEGVQVVAYEVWRRDWSDPLGDYVLVAYAGRGTAPKPGAGAGTGSPAARSPAPSTEGFSPGVPGGGSFTPPEVLEMMRGAAPGGGPAPARGTPQPAEAQPSAPAGAVSWRDTGVKPGVSYAYRARLVGANTYPARGEFTGSVTAEATPGMDFRFTLTGTDSVRFEVVKASGSDVQKGSFWVSVGDEIGGVDRRTNFLTGYTLADFHAQANEPGTNVRSSRVIYAGKDGVLRARYRNQVVLDDLWRRASAPTGTGR